MFNIIMTKITKKSINKKIDNNKSVLKTSIKKSKNEIQSNLNKKKYVVKGCFLLVFLTLALVSLNHLSNLDDYIPFNNYTYRIIAEEDIDTLENVKIYHDFSKNTGEISFNIEKINSNNKTIITINLPEIIDSETLKIFSKTGTEEEEEFTNIKISQSFNTYKNYTKIKLKNLNYSDIEEVFYTISYEMEILPSGKFAFEHFETNFFGVTPIVAFDLGKNFKCSGSCIDNQHNIAPDYPNTDKQIRLKLERTETKFHSFIFKGIRDIRNEQSIYTGAFVSLIMALALLSKEIAEELLYKNKE